MPRVVIYTAGTLGDHLPFIALGRALKCRGYEVCMAINRAMQDYAQRAGLEVFTVTDIERGPEEARENAWAWDHWHNPRIEEHPKSKPLESAQYLTQARELIDLCREADLFLSTSIRPLGFVAHSAIGLPWLTVSLNPYTFWQSPSAEEWKMQLESRFKEYYALIELIAFLFDELGIDQPIPPWSLGWPFARHVLLASSPYFSSPNLDQFQPRSSIDMTGFWHYEDPDWKAWQPDEMLREFCDRRPIVLTFSSQPLEDPGHFLRLHVEAAARLDMPLLVQRGWAGFSEADLPDEAEPDDVMFTDFLPHDWIFARAACSIQHGGIGSIARALRQGCPLLVEPFGNDQYYNATRVVELGAGVLVHPFETSVDELTELLGRRVLAPDCRQRAEDLGARLRSENGLETACCLIEIYLERMRSGEGNQSTRAVPLLYSPHPPNLNWLPPADSRAEIPKIIHQTWRNALIPPDLLRYQRTWQTHHPDWTYYLWTDEDNREFLRLHYPWFLSIYDEYPEMIMRVDAVRYFILHYYGGVYADLDAECFRPLDSILKDRQTLFSLEPEVHLKMHQKGGYPLAKIVSNAVMASVPGHPFWDHVFKQLVAYHRTPGALDATGPFFLTRAYESYSDKGDITIESANLFLPVTNERAWEEMPPEVRDQITSTAYTAHHWRGTWWREPAALREKQVRVTVLARGDLLSASALQLDQAQRFLRMKRNLPLVSCLMVTKNRASLARRAVHCFVQQTYPNKELLIVDDGEDNTLQQWVQQLNHEQIRYYRLAAENKTLGELRNFAANHARGVYIAQWDDDDLSDPFRLEVELAVIQSFDVDACTLERQSIWWPQSRRLAVSCARVWEGSFVCAKAKLPAYPAQPRGEDTPAIQQVVRDGRVALLDFPQLYTYVFHGENTFAAEHWEEHWRAATERYEGDLYDITLGHIQDRLAIDLSDTPGSDGVVMQSIQSPVNEYHNVSFLASQQEVEPVVSESSAIPLPKILILVPVKDATRYLPHLWENLKALTYPHDRVSLGFLESDSADGTYDLIETCLPELRAKFAKVKLLKRDYAYRSDLPRWEPSQQFRRRSIMAKSRNMLLAQALEDEEWVLWLDVDVARWPNDVIEQLLAARKDIVAPNCLAEQTGETFDYNTFKLKPGAASLDWSPYLVDGILQPPKGFGRLYLSDLRQYDCVEVDGVGGTMLFVRADIHHEGLVFPTFSYKHYIETEGLAVMARDMGYTCWGLPNLEIFHP